MAGKSTSAVLLITAMFLLSAGCASGNAGKAAGTVPAEGKRLNNFVIEYVNTSLKAPRKGTPDRPFRTFEIDHFRNGWIFIRGRARGGAAYVTIDSDKRDDSVLVLGEKSAETMRYVSQGKHLIKVFTTGARKIENFVLRSIPESQISELHFAIYDPPLGSRKLVRDWEFYRKHINPNVNVIISDADANGEWEPYATEWRRQGGKWLFKTSGGINFALLAEKGKQEFEDHYFNEWTRHLRQRPYIDGTAIDEWSSAKVPAAYLSFANIFDRIARDPACKGKQMHVYGLCGGRPWFKPGLEAIQRNNFTYLHEGYFFLRDSAIPGDDPDHEKFIEQYAGRFIADRYKEYPGLIENNLVYVVGVYNYHVSLDVSPNLDFKVFLDMQFHHYANYPTLKGLYGVSLYPPAYAATTDLLLYASKLLRHYCIEGNQDRMTDAPLRLPHLKNPGFEKGLESWEVKRAVADSVAAVTVKETGFKKRYADQVPPSGEKMLRMIRSDKAPNKVSQRMVGLKPGECYSLTLYTADYSDFGALKIVPVSINLDGADEVTEERVDRPIYTGDYGGIDRGCWNYRFRVFRARETTAVLTLSDWESAETAGKDAGHKIMWDHIKVQPYDTGDPGAD